MLRGFAWVCAVAGLSGHYELQEIEGFHRIQVELTSAPMQLRPLTRHSEQERDSPYMLSTMYIHLISPETRYEVPVLQGRFILMQHPYLLSHRDGSL